MHNRIRAATVLVLVALALVLIDAGHGDGEESFAWRTDLGKAVKEARGSGKPLMIVFR